MANHKSAKKRAKQNIIRNQRNKANRSKVRSALQKARQTIETKDADKSQVDTVFKEAQSVLAKAAQNGAISRKSAARKTSRLSLRAAKVSS